nr:MAG TPA: Helicase of the snf2 rad54 family [Caudoviricetes sp.]
MTDKYEEFLRRKEITVPSAGIDVEKITISDELFDFQRDIVLWALKKGKAAIFAGTGLGKTLMQLEWARHIGGTVLTLAPLAVSKQTISEGGKFGITVHHCRAQEDVIDGGINITNYERMDRFDFSKFLGVVLDESSILKAQAGKIRAQLIACCQQIPYRLACTATPAPNDIMELCNHSEFLGVMSSNEMLATFFVHDGGDTSKWRLKRHAVHDFWRWVASWSVMLTNPADLGYDGERYKLPPLRISQHTVHTERQPEALFAIEALTLQERQQARRDSVEDRARECAVLVNADTDQWIVWCNLNSEADALKTLIPDAVEVSGSDKPDVKERAAVDFAAGRIRVLISKPLIFGMGLNFQRCHKMAFVGLSDSFEQYYQSVRRCWRFGQEHPVDVRIITADTEGAVVQNIQRKEKQFEEMLRGMIAVTQNITKDNIRSTARQSIKYNPREIMIIPSWLNSSAA